MKMSINYIFNKKIMTFHRQLPQLRKEDFLDQCQKIKWK